MTFFRHVLEIFPLSPKNAGFLASLGLGVAAVITIVLTLLSSRFTLKPAIILFLLTASAAAYFMDNYNVVIDHIMIQNILQTNPGEALELLSTKLLLYCFFLGILPSTFVMLAPVKQETLQQVLFGKIRNIFISFLLILALVLCFSKFYSSFFREHKPLRYYTNPTYFIYSTGEYVTKIFNKKNETLLALGNDAKIVENNEKDQLKELVILVVGEAARADHFSLNGYPRETNPMLKQESIINFSQMTSCGTSTAYSIPCMFSIFERKNYNDKKGRTTENILDVFVHAGNINILWRDNNSDSKGVALRVPYENFRDPLNNPICSDGECRDIGMLAGLDQYIAQRKDQDILIILHQMGNHGPAYYKRYPKEFERFTPVCATNQLEKCSKEEINNTYDNALLYTDFFLSKVIEFLKKYDTSRETAMIYMSDHGESLGELGVYLHGLPYVVAPDAQTHIGAVLWLGTEIAKETDLEQMKKNVGTAYSHDNLFHTLLGIFEVKTESYNKNFDLLPRLAPITSTALESPE
jgi:lipid A ethanolaminephosphotransferase